MSEVKYGGMKADIAINTATDNVGESRVISCQIVGKKEPHPMYTFNFDTGEVRYDSKRYADDDISIDLVNRIKNELNMVYGTDDYWIDNSFRTSNRISFEERLWLEEYIDKVHTPKKVIYSGPCTIVFFNDGTKEIVRMCPDEKCDDREKAVMYAIMKHIFGKNKLNKIFNSAEDKRNE